MIALDTNILAYASDNLAGERHLQATRLVRSAISVNAAVAEQCLFEFLNMSAVKSKRSMKDALTLAQGFASRLLVLYPPATIIDDVFRLLGRHNLNVWDARMIAVCSSNACKTLLSEDMQDGATYGDVQVLNPFNLANARLLSSVFES